MTEVPSGFRNKRTAPFTMLANAMLRDPRLSLKAKGLLGLMLSFPDDWTYHMRYIETLSTDGRDGHRAAVKELEVAGYITREQGRNEYGQMATTNFRVSDVVYTVDGFSGDGFSGDGKSPTTKTDSTNTDSTKKKDRGEPSEEEKPTPLPEWLPEKAWADFLTYRKGKKVAVTELSATRLLKTLEDLRGQGHDPEKVIDQTIASERWIGLFPIKAQTASSYTPQAGAVRGQDAAVSNKNFTTNEEAPF